MAYTGEQPKATQITGLPTAGMVNLADNTLGSGAASVTFSSIAGTAKSLQDIVSARSDVAGEDVFLDFRLNGDTGANYDYVTTQNTASAISATGAAASTAFSPGTIPGAGATASVTGSCVFTILDYASTTFKKSGTAVCAFADGTTTQGGLTFTNWRSTAAVTSITHFPGAGNLVTGSRFTLQGIQ